FSTTVESPDSPSPHSIPPPYRPFSDVFSKVKEVAMEAYVAKALQHGFIRPSTSPVGVGFFFIQKKGGGLRPCIEYWALNEAFMDEIFWDMMGKFMMVYIDDILIFFRSDAEHVEHVTAVLTCLRRHRLYAKAKK
ncbi:hypothetical protein P4O66_020196, partial [Electrophorus voltai]